MSAGTKINGLAKKAFHGVTSGYKDALAYRKAEEVLEAQRKVEAAKQGEFDGGIIADIVDAGHDLSMNMIDFAGSTVGLGAVGSKIEHGIRRDLNTGDNTAEHKENKKANNGVDKRTVTERAATLSKTAINGRAVPTVSEATGDEAQLGD